MTIHNLYKLFGIAVSLNDVFYGCKLPEHLYFQGKIYNGKVAHRYGVCRQLQLCSCIVYELNFKKKLSDRSFSTSVAIVLTVVMYVLIIWAVFTWLAVPEFYTRVAESKFPVLLYFLVLLKL